MTDGAYATPLPARLVLSSAAATAALIFGLLPVPLVVFQALGGAQALADAMYPNATGFEDLGVILVTLLITAIVTVVGGIVALTVGIVAIVRITQGRARGRVRAVIGLVLGAGWILVVMLLLITRSFGAF